VNNLKDLSDEGCLAVLAEVGQKYVNNAGYDSRTAAIMVDAMVRTEIKNLPVWYNDPASSISASGPVARRALQEMLNSGNERLVTLVCSGIAGQETKKGEVIGIDDLVVGGGILISLAVLSKIKYSKEKGWEIEPGFPQLAEVLDKAGNLIDKMTGGKWKAA
jgi:hypothetical protein